MPDLAWMGRKGLLEPLVAAVDTEGEEPAPAGPGDPAGLADFHLATTPGGAEVEEVRASAL